MRTESLPIPRLPAGCAITTITPANSANAATSSASDSAKPWARNTTIHVVTGGRNNLNYGHVCGTCRYGDDPKTSVLDPSNRAHDVDNLYVVDGSFFPSSGGTNPSLTIAANAMRVAELVHQRLT